MKKLMYVVLLSLGVTAFVACSVDTNDEATATIEYEGYCDSVVYEDVLDTVFTPYIMKIITSKTAPLSGSNSVFSETATINDASYRNAVYNCNIKAMQTYESMQRNVSSKVLRDLLETSYGDSVNVSQLGFFTIYYSLYGFIDMQTVKVGTVVREY